MWKVNYVVDYIGTYFEENHGRVYRGPWENQLSVDPRDGGMLVLLVRALFDYFYAPTICKRVALTLNIYSIHPHELLAVHRKGTLRTKYDGVSNESSNCEDICCRSRKLAVFESQLKA